VFYYPADTRDPAKPQGKLRLLYEAAPMGYLIEQAGGYASTGRGSVLDVEPHLLHERTPVFMGNRDLVEKAEAFIKKYDG
jgi:fructose-1,6-bisphosphatase